MNNFQKHIAQSRWALPITAAYGLVVTSAAGLVTDGLWLNFAMLLVSTVMMAELNNYYALIRIYSRMVSCSFLVMTTMSLFLFRSLDVAAVQLTMIGFLLLILRSYQDPRASGWTFYAFLSLGIGSVVFPQMLLFVPLLWILMAVCVISFSPRTFMSSLLGLLTPYWLVLVWLLYEGNVSWLGAHFLSVVRFTTPFDLSGIGIHQWLTFAFVLVAALTGAIHFILYSYQDRIRIRLIYEMFMTIDGFCFLLALVQPQFFDCLMGMAIVLTAPLIGHFLALTHSRLSGIAFIVFAVAALGLTIFNITLAP